MKIKFAALICILAGFSFAAPKPSLAPEAGIWTLDIVFEQPKQYSIRNAEGEVERYWYIILTLTNNTGRDVPFIPNFELMTDTWKIYRSDTGITRPVYNNIKRMNAGGFPFLVTLDELEAKILQGKDNSVDLLVVWKDFDPKAKAVDMFLAGFSNETAVVEVEKDDETVRYHLQKTLKLSFNIPGDKLKREHQNLIFQDRTWVMR